MLPVSLDSKYVPGWVSSTEGAVRKHTTPFDSSPTCRESLVPHLSRSSDEFTEITWMLHYRAGTFTRVNLFAVSIFLVVLFGAIPPLVLNYVPQEPRNEYASRKPRARHDRRKGCHRVHPKGNCRSPITPKQSHDSKNFFCHGCSRVWEHQDQGYFFNLPRLLPCPAGSYFL